MPTWKQRTRRVRSNACLCRLSPTCSSSKPAPRLVCPRGVPARLASFFQLLAVRAVSWKPMHKFAQSAVSRPDAGPTATAMQFKQRQSVIPNWVCFAVTQKRSKSRNPRTICTRIASNHPPRRLPRPSTGFLVGPTWKPSSCTMLHNRYRVGKISVRLGARSKSNNSN